MSPGPFPDAVQGSTGTIRVTAEWIVSTQAEAEALVYELGEDYDAAVVTTSPGDLP